MAIYLAAMRAQKYELPVELCRVEVAWGDSCPSCRRASKTSCHGLAESARMGACVGRERPRLKTALAQGETFVASRFSHGHRIGWQRARIAAAYSLLAGSSDATELKSACMGNKSITLATKISGVFGVTTTRGVTTVSRK